MYLYVCSAAQPRTLYGLFGVDSFARLDEDVNLNLQYNTKHVLLPTILLQMILTELDTPQSKQLHALLRHLQEQRWNVYATVVLVR